MHIEYLSLTNFRNYAQLELPLPNHTIVLHGDNAQGKTSLLEAFYYLATARSPYTTSDRQLIHWRTEGELLPFARLAADIHTRHHPFSRLEITLMMDTSAGTPRFKKIIRLDHVDKRVMDIVGILNVVMFLPQHLHLIEGSPNERRRFMNETLSQMNATYYEALHRYEKALPQRNALLRNIAMSRAGVKELAFWDDELVRHGSTIIASRQRFLRELEFSAQRIHAELTDKKETLTLNYIPSLVPTATAQGQLSFEMFGFDLHRQLEPSELEPQFHAQLEREREESIQRGMTLTGPHRDELRLNINGRDVGLYGSRGQARTTVMALKLAELAWMTEQSGQRPILLLDEVIAELDARRRGYLLDQLTGDSQTVLTTTEPTIFTPEFLKQSTLWRIHNGQIIEEDT